MKYVDFPKSESEQVNETDRQTGRQADGYTGRQTGRQADR